MVLADTIPLPLPTTAVIVVSFRTVMEVAGTPPKLTEVAPEILAPVIVSIVPAHPIMGVKEEIVGGKLQPVGTLAIKFPREYGFPPTLIDATALVEVLITLTLVLL